MATTIQNIELPKKPRARDTSGNNNHGKIYSGRGLEFDGVTDYLSVSTDVDTEMPHMSQSGTFTVACWVKQGSSKNQTVWYAVHTNGNSRVGLGFGDNGEVAFVKYNGTAYTYAGNTTANSLNINTWYRAVCVMTSGSQKMYLNGVELTGEIIGSANQLGSTQSDKFIIGEKNNVYFDGAISDFQSWDAAWTATDAAYDYVNPESLALNASGSALTESNLKVWYPMQDGHRGQQSYILDGANTGLGVELIENNDFSSVDNWNAGGGWEVLGNNKATNDGTGGILRQTNTVPLNTRFKVVFTVADYVTGNIQIKFAPVAQTVSITGNNTYTVYTAGDNSVNDDFQIIGTSGFDGSITNISVKAINDKNHATTVFTGDELWDLADNHTANWSTTGGATKAAINGSTDGVKLTFGGTATNENGSYIWLKDTTTNTLTEDLTVGRIYKLSGKFATDVAGATNAPRILVYASGNNYPSPSTVPATNLVTNGTMEVDDNYSAWGGGVVERSDTQAHNGTYSWKFTATSDDDGIRNHPNSPFTTVNGTTYLVSFWIYPDDGTVCSVFNRKGGEAAIGTRKNVTGLTQDAWNKVEMQFTEDVEGDDAYIAVTSSTDTSGDFYVDDLVVTAFVDREIEFVATHATDNNFYHFNCDYVAANEMIEQGSNANNSTFASSIGDWVVNNGSGGGAAIAHSTDAGGTITINPTTNAATEGMKLSAGSLTDQEIGRSYTVLVRMKSDSGSPEVRVALGQNVAAAQEISTTATTYAFVVTPTNITGALRVETGTTDDINIIVYSCEVYPHCNLFVDDISFKEVGVASGWTDADQQLHIPQTALQSYNELAWFGGFVNCEVALGSAINTASNSWSLSFWLYEEENNYSFSWPIGQATHSNILTKNSNSRRLHYRNITNYYPLAPVDLAPLGQWNHFVIAATGDTKIQAYVNGAKQAENSDMTATVLLVDNFMNGYGSGNHFVVGSITEVAYYNTVLTDANALDLFNDGKAKSALEASGSAGLVGYWRNNGLSTWTDLKGSNNGTPNAVVTETILIPQGVDTTRDSQGFLMNKKRSTGSLNLTDGYDNPYVDLGSTTTVADDEASSFVMWLKPDDLTNNHIFGLDTSNTFLISNSTTITKQADGEAKYFSTSLVAYEWVHIAVVKKASNDLVTIYKDGTALTDTETLNEPFDYRYLGAKDSTNSFRGSIDGFLIYNSELSATEVLQNYNATKRDHKN